MSPIIAAAIPFFFVLLALELVVARRRRVRLHRFNDSIADLGCGVGDQVLAVFVKSLTIVPYTLVHARVPWKLDGASPATWILGLLLVDFFYYWFHRFSHRVNLGWATHVVHHQSEEYNLAVALRQSWLGQLYGWVFYVPVALLGVPPEVYAGSYALNLLYQFWIHTRAIDRLGPVEWIFNTPSHHRVHHGCNGTYLDRNYAGILIVWDRLFGTFRPEAAEPSYGTVRPLGSWSPLWANVEPFVALARESRAAARAREALAVWVAPPEWHPPSVPAAPPPSDEALASRERYDADAARQLHPYVVAHFALLALGLMALMLAPLPAAPRLALAAFILAGISAFAALLESRPWARPLELARLAALPLLAWAAAPSSPPAWAAAAAVAAGSVAWLLVALRPAAASRAEPPAAAARPATP